MTSRPRLLGYISVVVCDFVVSRVFFTAILEPLGLKLVYDRGPMPARPQTLSYRPDRNHKGYRSKFHKAGVEAWWGE
jgi:hypothetical protein